LRREMQNLLNNFINNYYNLHSCLLLQNSQTL